MSYYIILTNKNSIDMKLWLLLALFFWNYCRGKYQIQTLICNIQIDYDPHSVNLNYHGNKINHPISSVLIPNHIVQRFNLQTRQTQPNLHFKSNASRWNLGTSQIPQQAPLSPRWVRGKERRDATHQLLVLRGLLTYSLTPIHNTI